MLDHAANRARESNIANVVAAQVYAPLVAVEAPREPAHDDPITGFTAARPQAAPAACASHTA